MDRFRKVGANFLRRDIWRRLRPDKRESIALLILLVPIAIGGVLALFDRPSRATLAVEQPSPAKRLTVNADGRDGHGRLQARSSIVAVKAFSLGSSGIAGPRARLLDVALPVSRADCIELRSRFGGMCGGAGARPTRAARALTVEWPGGGRVALEAGKSRRLQLRPTPVAGEATGYRALNLRIDAPVTKVTFECTKRVTFRLIFSGSVEPLRCVYGLARYSVLLAYEPPLAPKLLVTGLGPWQFEGVGTEARTWVDRGLLTVGDGERTLGAAETKVTIAADQQHRVSAVVGNIDSGDSVNYTVETHSASSVEVAGSQALPSRLSQYENYWLLIIGVVGGVLLAIYFERVPRNDNPERAPKRD